MGFTCLSNLLHVVPGGWKYTQEDSGFELRGGDYYDLREKVRKHRQINDFFAGPDLDNEIQLQICTKLPPNARAIFCRPCESLGPGRSVDLEDVRSFLQVAVEWMKKREFVPQLEADTRAEICASCPKNIAVAGCSTCRGLIKYTLELIGHKRTPFDDKLGACEVCGCSNQAQIHLPLEALKKGITRKMKFPDWCWKRSAVQTSQSAP